ncbi:flavohemoprotein, partial [Kitasatospora sp. A2-31]|nr:flavohemoprotein [Kitasatospora sp. A2-31]MCG6500488.1 flavohemoprotein [Kitasatospora sp. A2-31]
MEISSSAASTEYDRLIARHHAMRLRRQILAPAPAFPAPAFPAPAFPATAFPGPADGRGGAPSPTGRSYDGAADQRLILRTLGLVTPFADLIDHLYRFMFLRRPYLRSLFPASMEFQRSHLERMFTYLVEHLDRPAELADTLGRLGRD